MQTHISAPASAASAKNGWIPLPVQMLLGLLVGAAIGILWPGIGKELLPLGQAFLKALRMLIVPLVFASIVLGIYSMGREIKVLGRVITIAFVWFYVATGSCIILGLGKVVSPA